MKFLFFSNTDWYLYNFRLPLARAVRSMGHEVILVSPAGKYSARFSEEGFRWINFPMNRRSINPFRELSIINRFRRVLVDHSPDVIHNFTIKCVIYGSLSAKLAKINHVVNAVPGLGYIFSNNSAFARLLRPIVTSLYRLVLSGSNTKVIFQNPDDQSFFIKKRLIHKSNCVLIKGSGVNVNKFTVTTDESLHYKKPLMILFAARLLLDKGVSDFVKAAEILTIQYGISAKFIVLGDRDEGNPQSVSPDQLQKWKNHGLVEFAGHVDDVKGYLDRCAIAVLPSKYGEGIPRFLLEAAACGKPLITSDIPGCREIVSHKTNGLLIEPGNINQLADAIITLVNDPNMRVQMGAHSREKAVNEFDEKIVFQKTIDLYKSILNEAEKLQINQTSDSSVFVKSGI